MEQACRRGPCPRNCREHTPREGTGFSSKGEGVFKFAPADFIEDFSLCLRNALWVWTLAPIPLPREATQETIESVKNGFTVTYQAYFTGSEGLKWYLKPRPCRARQECLDTPVPLPGPPEEGDGNPGPCDCRTPDQCQADPRGTLEEGSFALHRADSFQVAKRQAEEARPQFQDLPSAAQPRRWAQSRNPG